MTSIEILNMYESLCELTGSMLVAARLGEWDQLTELEQQCQPYVSNLMQSTPLSMSESEQRTKISVIRAILKNDAKIRALVDPHMNALQQRLGANQKHQRGVDAYGEQRA